MVLLADVGVLEIVSHLDRIGMAGLAILACVSIWKYWTKRVEDMEKEHRQDIDDKDKAIHDLQIAYAQAAREHAAKIEALQGVTITKIEEWSDKTGMLIERVIEVQAQANQTVRRLSLVDDERK